MTQHVVVRRVRPEDWERVRELRIEAVRDPDAAIAFLSTPEQELGHDDGFWQDRARKAAAGEESAQLIAEVGGEWAGTATVLVRPAGATDHTGRRVYVGRADVVGVFVRAEYRGSGVIDALLDSAAEWTAALGLDRLTLDVHADNTRAQAAYRRGGFVPTGVTFTSMIGPELEMARSL